MADRQKVIKGLETIKQFFGYGLPSTAEMFDSYYGILNDAIALLKEQEEAHKILVEKADEMYAMLKEQKAVKPVLFGRMWECGNCHAPVGIYLDDIRDDFCRKCGKKVKWDEVHSNI